MRGHRFIGVAAALAWLAVVFVFVFAGCRRTAPAPAPFSRAAVLAQIGPSYPGVTLPSDELPAGVIADEELVYARPDGAALALDLYRPSSAGPHPAVIVVHGGGWERGDRRMERPLAKQLAARGFAAATVSYRLGAAGRFPHALFDLESAVRWLRAHAARFALDSAHVGAVGGSAGGQLVALLGVSAGTPATPALVGGEGEETGEGDARVQAVVDIDGLADFSGEALVAKETRNPGAPTRFLGGSFADRAATWRLASPLHHVRAGCAPTLFINSTATDPPAAPPGDLTGAPRVGAPVMPGRAEMRDRLRALGIDSDLVVMPETPHPFWLVNPWFDVVLDRTAAFFNKHLRGSP